MSLSPAPPELRPPLRPIVWTVAGSDTCGGAGIQTDLKTFQMLGVHGCSVIAALTAQNTQKVLQTQAIPADMLAAQIDALAADMPPKAIKTGMLGDAAGIKILAGRISALKTYLVCDPVLVSSSGVELLSPDAVAALKQYLFPLVDILTPNCGEAEFLTGRKIESAQDAEQAAQNLRAVGPKAVVIKGFDSGHGLAQDFYSDGEDSFWLTSKRREGKTARGTGCTFASTLAAAHALGFWQADAVVIAKAYVNQCLRLAQPLGRGMPILTHAPWPVAPPDFPWLTKTAEQGRERPQFPYCGPEPLGFYPVVDSYEWLERLLPLGVKTAQLRVKNLAGDALEAEIGRSIECARAHDCRLFINDYWQIAIRHKAYGVHLGQGDLATADIDAIQKSGLRLGLSTHCYFEVARALSLRPSYIAIGPIFPTTLKSMKFAPQGIAALRQWRQMLDGPLVAIGGIALDRAEEIRAAGAGGIAVVSDITNNEEPEKRVRKWLEVFGP